MTLGLCIYAFANILHEGIKSLVQLVLQLLIGPYLVVDIIDREDESQLFLGQEGIQLRLAKTIAFAGESLDTIAIHRMMELALGGIDEHLCLGFKWSILAHGNRHPADAERERHDTVALMKELVYQRAAAQMFLLAEGKPVAS